MYNYPNKGFEGLFQPYSGFDLMKSFAYLKKKKTLSHK